MRVIIIGAGKVGYQIADTLSNENYDIIVIDQDEQVINKVEEHLDVLTIQCNGLAGQSLKEIGLNEDDLVIAVTDSDEGNILACLSAKKLGAGQTIARIRNPEYSEDVSIFKEHMSIDYIINPEKSTADEIARMLNFSPAGQIEDFAKGKVQMLGIPVDGSNPFVHIPLKDLPILQNILIGAIFRKGQLIIPKGQDTIQPGDNIHIIGRKSDTLEFCKAIGKYPKKVRSFMIFGGSRIAYYLTKGFEHLNVSVKIIERDPHRCQELAERLPNALVINGDGSDIDLLKSENVDAMDAFIALTGMDEENILVALLAKQLGAARVISKISRPNYMSLVETLGVDAAVMPSMITTADILRYVRGEKVQSLFLLSGGQAVVMELIAQPGCEGIHVPLKDLSLPKNTIIASIVRNGRVIIPHGNDMVYTDDRVIFLGHSSEITKAARLFMKRGENRNHEFWNHFSSPGLPLNR